MKLRENIPGINAEDIAEPELVQRLTRRHGQPWQLNDKGTITAINYQWWADLYVAENYVIRSDKRFFVYDEIDHVYLPDDVDHMVRGILLRLLCVARDLGAPELENLRYKKFETFGTHLRAIPNEPDAFQSANPMLALRNGVIEFTQRGFRFKDFSPDIRIRHKGAFDYDPNADCPRLRQMLGEMFDPDDMNLILQHLALIIAGVNPSHIVGIIEGPGAAGKTTLLNLIIRIIEAERAIQLRPDMLESQFELHSFHGKTLLYGVDVGEDFLNSKAAHVIKALSGGDHFHTEGKYSPERAILKGPFNVLITTNCKLSYYSQDDADAWRRRLIIYKARCPENRQRIVDFENLLFNQEAPGILNLLLHHLTIAMHHLNSSGDLPRTQEQIKCTEQIVLRSKSAQVFAANAIEENKESNLTTTELFEAYLNFCQSMDWKPLSQRIFGSQLNQFISETFNKSQTNDIQRNGKNHRGFRGLALREQSWHPTSQN